MAGDWGKKKKKGRSTGIRRRQMDPDGMRGQNGHRDGGQAAPW